MQYLSPKQAAAQLGISTALVYREINAGRITALRIGDPNSPRPVYRIPVSALGTPETGDRK